MENEIIDKIKKGKDNLFKIVKENKNNRKFKNTIVLGGLSAIMAMGLCIDSISKKENKITEDTLAEIQEETAITEEKYDKQITEEKYEKKEIEEKEVVSTYKPTDITVISINANDTTKYFFTEIKPYFDTYDSYVNQEIKDHLYKLAKVNVKIGDNYSSVISFPLYTSIFNDETILSSYFSIDKYLSENKKDVKKISSTLRLHDGDIIYDDTYTSIYTNDEVLYTKSTKKTNNVLKTKNEDTDINGIEESFTIGVKNFTDFYDFDSNEQLSVEVLQNMLNELNSKKALKLN